jgi:UDP-3-O-[3-hydroxymyristoyl] glucosamine N-acyltransferase
MQKTLGEIARLINGELIGDSSLVITGFSGIKEAQKGDLTFLANSKYFSLAQETKASAIITPRDATVNGKAIIRTDNPSLAFSNLLTQVGAQSAPHFKGIDINASIAKDAVIGKNVSIGPFVIIESGVKIGDNTVIYGGCFIGHKTTIGRDGLIYPNVTIRELTVIGDRTIIHSGTVIGSDGFGFVPADGRHLKIPQIGNVVIEDDVEIGANVTIDRARFDKTVIGQGTKIDNLVQIAHNVRLGKHCLIVSQTGISGSTVLEDHVTLAGQVGIVGHVTIGQGAVVGAQSGVSNSIPAKTIVWGFPAKEISEAKRVNAGVQRLPHYIKIIIDLKKRVEELEAKLKDKKA